MNSRDRLLAVLRGDIPDCVPVAPDFSNMIPARLTGKPFWDLYLYNAPPIWEAYIDCAKHFNMGDYDLAELKRLYGAKIVLKGNLHTTEVMLRVVRGMWLPFPEKRLMTPPQADVSSCQQAINADGTHQTKICWP